MSGRYLIGELSKLTGLSVDTLRFYERRGLLDRPARTAARYRVYDPSAIDRIQFIKRAKALGLSLAEIQELVRFNGKRGLRRCARVRDLLTDRLGKLEVVLSDLEGLRAALRTALGQCERAIDSDDPSACPVIDLEMAREGLRRGAGAARRRRDAGVGLTVNTRARRRVP